MNKVLYTSALSLTCMLSACANFNKQDDVAQQNHQPASSEAHEEGTKSVSTVNFDSGLKKETLKKAAEDSKSPTKGQRVTVHYTGWLEENGKPGRKFDSSLDRGRTFTFIIGQGQVIKGWDEGVMSMKVGEKARLYIPSKLGYGSHGAGALIPPNATLIFDVELISLA